jgi:hypothetical protein
MIVSHQLPGEQASATAPAPIIPIFMPSSIATAAASAGVPERAIMAQTGHKSLATMGKYIREGSLFQRNAATKV